VCREKLIQQPVSSFFQINNKEAAFNTISFMVNTLAHFLDQAISGLRTVSYLEGGPEATLSIKIGDF